MRTKSEATFRTTLHLTEAAITMWHAGTNIRNTFTQSPLSLNLSKMHPHIHYNRTMSSSFIPGLQSQFCFLRMNIEPCQASDKYSSWKSINAKNLMMKDVRWWVPGWMEIYGWMDKQTDKEIDWHRQADWHRQTDTNTHTQTPQTQTQTQTHTHTTQTQTQTHTQLGMVTVM